MAVRGTFDLNDRPATEALGRVKREGAATDLVLQGLGKTMDDVFSERNASEARGYVKDLNEVRDAAGEVEAALRTLGTTNARPKIDLDGYEETLAKLDRIEERMRKIGTLTARPNVSTSTSTHGRVGGGGGRGGLNIPFAGSLPWPIVAGALGAAPPLIGGATGLIGSAGAAALGAGALGLTGYATAGVGAGLAAGPTIATISGIKEASKALAAYQKQVIETGPNSKAAAQKLRLYNIAAKETPGSAEFLKARTLFGREFNSMTKPGQESVAGIGTRGINLGRQLLPTIAPLSNEFLGEAQTQTGNFANFLSGNRSQSFINSIGQEAINDLAPAEKTIENIAGTVMNLAQASKPFFHEGVVFLGEWTKGWKTSTNDLGGTRKEIGGLVDDLKSWGHLGGAGFTLMEDLLKPAAGPGTSMVDDLTEQLDTWDEWVKNNPREITNFFEKSAEGTEKIAGGLSKITTFLFEIGKQLTPLVEEGATLVQTLSSAGLLSTGGLPLLLAGGAGVRNFKKGLGGKITGTAATGSTGMVPFVGGGRGPSTFGSFGTNRYGAPLGAGEIGSAYALEREAGVSRIGALSTVARSTKVGGAVESLSRGFLGSIAPYLMVSGGLGALGTEGNFLDKVAGGANQATFGLFPAPPNKNEEAEKGARQAQYILSKITGNKDLSMAQKERRLYGAYAHTVEIGTQGIGPETLSAEEEKVRAKTIAHGRVAFREYQGEARKGRAEGVVADIGESFGIRAEHGKKGAGRTAISELEKEAKTFHGNTLKQFDQLGMEWARELAKGNPKLKGVVNEYAEGIEQRFARMGQSVEIINGKIVDTSGKSWSKVNELLTTNSQIAYSEVNKNFTALEKRAFSILEHMGYKPGQAQSIVHEAQKGTPTKRGSELNAQAHNHGQASKTINNMATGGRIPMTGTLHDTVPIPGGGMAAGGELYFANRHTENRVDKMLGQFGTSLGREIANEGRAHSEQPRAFALGGRGKRPGATAGTAWRGIGPAGLHQGIREVAGVVLGHYPGLSVTSTTSGGHVSGSLHYAGEAVDVAGDTQTMFDASAWIKQTGLYRQLTEGIHNPNLSVSDGKFVDPSYYAAVWGEHANHIHLGVAHAVGQIGKLAAGAGGARGGVLGSAAQHIRLKGAQSKLGGFGGAMVTRSNEMQAAGLEQNINKILGKRGGGLAGGSAAPGGSRSAVERQIARVLFSAGANKVGAAGIIGNAYAESSMDPGAEGTGGGGLWGFTAGAISLANLKAAGGNHWTSPEFQTRFMLQHGGSGLIPALNKAGTPEAAAALFMNQWERPGIPRQDVREGGARTAFTQGFALGGRRPGFAGWFARGGHFRVKNPTLFGAGEGHGPEDVQITPAGRGRTGSGGHTFKIALDLRGAHIGNESDAKRIAGRLADELAGKLAGHLESSDGVPERELTG
jgi:hypothetical protein